jgi:ADP-ribosylglycohydrolase
MSQLSLFNPQSDTAVENKPLKINTLHNSKTIIGAIAGDVIGSCYEGKNIKAFRFPLFTSYSTFTDDTVLTMAVADAILNKKDFKDTIWAYGKNYPNRGYGGLFRAWLKDANPQPYDSFGNGSAMRVSAVGFAFNTLDTVLAVAKQSAEMTHNHPEGIKGAQATAAAVFLARTGSSKDEIKAYIETTFDYNLDESLDDIRPHYRFDVTCQGSVPQSIRAFLESTDYENAIRLAISIGGDSDTIACIAGGIAAAFYKHIPSEITEGVVRRLPKAFVELLDAFEAKFINN